MDDLDRTLAERDRKYAEAYRYATTPMTPEQKKRLYAEKKMLMKRHRNPKPPRVPPEQFGFVHIKCYECGHYFAPCKKYEYTCPMCEGLYEEENTEMELPF